MKKIALALALATAASSASAAYVGGTVGSGFSVHYGTQANVGSSMRYSLNLDALGFNYGSLTLGGSVDYLADLDTANSYGSLAPYYGLGLGAGVALGNVTGVSVYPHALLGLRYNVSGPLSVFGELNAGPNITVATGATGIGFGFGARLGLNYQLN